jgi:hypothetical protein
VWVVGKDPAPTVTLGGAYDTGSFFSDMTIGASWHEESVEQVKSLIEDEELSISLLMNQERIERRVRQLAKEGWTIPEAWEVSPAGSVYLPRDYQEGLTEGYATAITVRTREE